jgi:hypothetical protein
MNPSAPAFDTASLIVAAAAAAFCIFSLELFSKQANVFALCSGPTAGEVSGLLLELLVAAEAVWELLSPPS